MNKAIQITGAIAVFVIMFFVGKQIDLSNQVIAVYEVFQNTEASGNATQKASVSEY